MAQPWEQEEPQANLMDQMGLRMGLGVVSSKRERWADLNFKSFCPAHLIPSSGHSQMPSSVKTLLFPLGSENTVSLAHYFVIMRSCLFLCDEKMRMGSGRGSWLSASITFCLHHLNESLQQPSWTHCYTHFPDEKTEDQWKIGRLLSGKASV